MLHAHDFLDQRLIEKGVFVPHYSEGSYTEAINEIVHMLQTTIRSRQLAIEFKTKKKVSATQIKFDKRRLQQVLMNVLQNAIKFQKQGKIVVKARLKLTDLDDDSDDESDDALKWMMLEVSVHD